MVLAFLLLSLQAAPQKETLQVPGTKLTFELVKIPGGQGVAPFSIGAREVTWAEYNVFYAEGMERKKANLDGVTRPTMAKSWLGVMGVPSETLSDARPVTNVRWHGALGYCEWLSRHTGRAFRLPTEKEWELAARGGERGSAPADLDGAAWHAGNAGKTNHDVGGKKPNAFGLYDMLGNVWEYCLEPDLSSGFAPVLRGGSWSVAAEQTVFASRRTVTADWFLMDVLRPRSVWWLASNKTEQGFRVVCVPDALDPKERTAVAKRIELKILRADEIDLGKGSGRDFFARVRAEVTNNTGRDIAELEIRVFYLTPEGRAHLIDLEPQGQPPGRPTFASCWPVLANSDYVNPSFPLKSKVTRTFEVDVPSTFDDPTDVDADKFGAAVMNVRFVKEEK